MLKRVVLFLVALTIVLFATGCDLFNREKVVLIPEIPANICVGEEVSDSLTIGWDRVHNANGYRVYRSTGFNEPFTRIGEEIHGLSYIDSGLLPLTTYWYRVSAFNEAGESNRSIQIGASTKDK
jgi:hypothetical protein